MVNLIDYLPEVFQDSEIFRRISDNVSPKYDACLIEINDLLDIQFIISANENGISRYEQLLGITPKLTNSLEDRRFRVLTIFSNKLPYTYESLKSELDLLCGVDGYDITLSSNIYTLLIRVALDKKEQFEQVDKLVNKRTPANMIIDLSLLYISHNELSNNTHSTLSGYNYLELREEAI